MLILQRGGNKLRENTMIWQNCKICIRKWSKLQFCPLKNTKMDLDSEQNILKLWVPIWCGTTEFSKICLSGRKTLGGDTGKTWVIVRTRGSSWALHWVIIVKTSAVSFLNLIPKMFYIKMGIFHLQNDQRDFETTETYGKMKLSDMREKKKGQE